MKKIITVLLISLISLLIVSCKQDDIDYNNNGLYIGHINIEKDTLYLDEIEWITNENEDRIKELKLTQSDMPNGYYMYNPSSDTVSFELIDNAVYNFIDWGNDFVGMNEDRNYSTTSKEDFIEYLNTYVDKAAKVPFWVDIKDGHVISVTEQFVN